MEQINNKLMNWASILADNARAQAERAAHPVQVVDHRVEGEGVNLPGRGAIPAQLDEDQLHHVLERRGEGPLIDGRTGEAGDEARRPHTGDRVEDVDVADLYVHCAPLLCPGCPWPISRQRRGRHPAAQTPCAEVAIA